MLSQTLSKTHQQLKHTWHTLASKLFEWSNPHSEELHEKITLARQQLLRTEEHMFTYGVQWKMLDKRTQKQVRKLQQTTVKPSQKPTAQSLLDLLQKIHNLHQLEAKIEAFELLSQELWDATQNPSWQEYLPAPFLETYLHILDNLLHKHRLEISYWQLHTQRQQYHQELDQLLTQTSPKKTFWNFFNYSHQKTYRR